MTTPLRLVYGYLYCGNESPDHLAVQREVITATAKTLDLLLDTVFIDYRVTPLAMNRPSLRSLLDVVRAFRPYGVLIPSPQHLSYWPKERADLLGRFQSLACPVLVADGRKASVLGAGRVENSGSS